jgi:RNA polymerase sigma factor (sigma-70 family)
MADVSSSSLHSATKWRTVFGFRRFHLSVADPDGITRNACQRIVRELIKQYEWQIISEDALVEWVLGSIKATITRAEVERLAKTCYAIALYEACKQSDDPVKRDRGYRELHRFLFRSAYKRWPGLERGVLEDGVQRALLLVYQQIESCRSPASFLGFASAKLRQAMTEEFRRRQREMPVDPDDIIPEPTQSSSSQVQIEREECRQALHVALGGLPEREQRAIVQKLLGFSDQEIADELGITANNVRVLRNRTIKRLRADPRLRPCLDFWTSP